MFPGIWVKFLPVSILLLRQPRHKYQGRNATCALLVGIKTSKGLCIAVSFSLDSFWWLLGDTGGDLQRGTGGVKVSTCREGWKAVCVQDLLPASSCSFTFPGCRVDEMKELYFS